MSVMHNSSFGENTKSFSKAREKDISWDEINKAKYYLYGPSFFMAVRVLIHPFAVVKTRLQMQNEVKAAHHQSVLVYNGTVDAFRKIVKHEGCRGLYKGFAVSSLGILSGQIYITTYEITRECLLKMNERSKLVDPGLIDVIRNAIAGGCASLLSQTIVVPIDVISQKQMMQKKQLESFDSLFHAPREIFRTQGIFGFYKGYFASLAVYAPSSALWWGFYGYFRDLFYKKAANHGWMVDTKASTYAHWVVEGGAAATAGVLSTVITNPMDVARTRLQVSGKVGDGRTLRSTLIGLWREEGARSTMKGVSARILATVPSSILIITVYELVKRLSLK